MKPPTLNINSQWVHQAECRDMNPDLFDLDHPLGGSSEAHEACSRCPVASACWATAVANGEVGVYRAGTEIRDPLRSCGHCKTEMTALPKRRFCSKTCSDAHLETKRAERREQQQRSQTLHAPERSIRRLHTHCVRGHEFTEANTYIRVTKTGQQRMCRTCKVDATRRTEGRPPLRRTA